jgi:Type IV secretion system pilin
MLKKIKISLLQLSALSLLITAGLGGVVAAQDTSGANPTGSLCSGAKNLQISSETTDNSECTGEGDDDPTGKVNELITQIINIFSVVVGIVAVIMIIYGGFKYITSGGDSGNVTGAKNTILYAIIGLIIVALAQFIVRFVLSKAAGTTE